MDEISLLRRARNDIPERAAEEVTRGRAALFVHLDSDMNAAPSSARHSRRTAAWVGFSVLGAATLTVALVVATHVNSDSGLSGGVEAEYPVKPTDSPDSIVLASAATVLKSAAIATLESSDPVVGPGQYLLVRTNAVHLAQGAIEADRAKIEANGGNIEQEDIVSYLEGSLDELYIPANRDDAWVWMRYARTPIETFGPRSEALAQEIGGFDADQLVRLPGGAFEDGAQIGSYYIGTEPAANYDALPRDPLQLLDTIYDLTENMGPSRDGEALVWIADLLRWGTVPAELRAALYKAAAEIPGVTITEQQATLDGTTGVAIGRDEANNGIRQDIIIDPATGQFIGERTVLLDGYADVPAGTVTTSTSVTTTVVDSAP